PCDERCEQPRKDEEYFAHLFILKPAIDLGTLLPTFQGCDPESLDSCNQGGANACRMALEELRRRPGYETFPAELFGFLVRNFKTDAHDLNSFPQNSTVWMTLQSSPTLFGA